MLLPRFENLELNCGCELLCPGCARWSEPTGEPDSLVLPRALAVNITGGNPLSYSGLPGLLVQLKKNKQFVALTTCGYRLENLEPKLLLLIDLILLYLPAGTGEKTIQRAGFNALNTQLRALEYLQEVRKKFAVLYPADRETIAELPDIYHKLNKKNSYLILLHDRQAEQRLLRADREYLRYYAGRSNVLVYTYRSGAPPNCLDFARQLARPSWGNFGFGLKLFYKFTFLR